MKYQKLINTNIKILRQQKNMTQEEFAEKIGISIQGLSNIERNRYQPSADTIDKICKVFNLSPIELLVTSMESDREIIKNIVAMLSMCKQQKLKKIYDIICIIVKM